MYEMFRIKEYPLKTQVACEKCASKGYIDKHCYSCNGKGIHNKTLSIWKPKQYTIDKIDRCSTTKKLRYWEDASCYFEEDSMLIHFNNKDAQNECNRRNIEKYGKEFCKQYL